VLAFLGEPRRATAPIVPLGGARHRLGGSSFEAREDARTSEAVNLFGLEFDCKSDSSVIPRCRIERRL
jgi:hypothetical protein